MEDSVADQSDHGPEWACASALPNNCGETSFQIKWDADIRRAALAAARGDSVDADDLAQEVRMRITAAIRTLPGAPTPYIRKVISNTLKSARRRDAHAFTVKSPMAEPVDDDFAAAIVEPDDGRDVIVAAWVGSLPSPMRRIYQHLYAEDLSQREAARLMNLSQPRVAQLHRQLLERGRQQLTRLAA
jgi:RNA polymerase sigma factor (sigma-70 family)